METKIDSIKNRLNRGLKKVEGNIEIEMMTKSSDAYLKQLHTKIKDSGPKLTFSNRPVIRSLSNPTINKASLGTKSTAYIDRLQQAMRVESRLSRKDNGNESNSVSRNQSAEGGSRKVSQVPSSSHGAAKNSMKYAQKHITSNIIASTTDMNVTEQ